MPVDASHPNQLTLEIKDLALDGTGLAQHDGKLVFVSGALPAETATVRITGQGRGKLHAEISELTCSSPDRRDPLCILAGKCGGCSLLHWHDQAQSQWKQQQLQNTLRRVGRLECVVEPIRSTQAVLGYRNRAIIPVQERDNALKAGFQRGSHQVVNMNHCPVLDPRLDALIEPLKQTSKPPAGRSTTRTPKRACCVSWFCEPESPAVNCCLGWSFETISSKGHRSWLSSGCSAGPNWWVLC